MRPVSNPPNPWASTHVEWLDAPPDAALEVFEEDAKSILSHNDSPDLGFRWSVNPYRGCFHSCAYCLDGDTAILMSDGRTRRLRDLRVGDAIIGTSRLGALRRYVPTTVLAHWSTRKPAFRVTLVDGTELIASGDHRFLTRRGWKHVAPDARPGFARPHLAVGDRMLGFGSFASAPPLNAEYRRGYLCGMVKSDDLEAHLRAREFATTYEVRASALRAAGDRPGEPPALAPMRTLRHASYRVADRMRGVILWPTVQSDSWSRGFLAGIFDAEGSHRRGVLRITSRDPAIIEHARAALTRFGFDSVVEQLPRPTPLHAVRLRGGLRERMRFFHLVAPAITHKQALEGRTVRADAPLEVRAIDDLELEMPMFDITTGTGDFIANGVVSHNCYARPTHQYLGYGAGTDFDRKLVVKVNAPELLREAFDKKSWQGEHVMFSGITDCYQPLEVSYEVTKRLLEVCAAYSNPVSAITKSMVIRRDVALWARLAREARAHVTISIPFARDDQARLIEPNASPPSRRFETMKALADAGVPVGIAVAPVIPGLNDPDIPELLERARDAGARHAFLILLRLPAEVLPVFRERIRDALPPERVKRIESTVVELRGGTGRMNSARFGDRFRGEGERWKAIETLFELHKKRHGLDHARWETGDDVAATTFRRPTPQLALF